jgi:antitoxin ParD1/3/4
MKDETMTDSDAPEWPDPADKAHAVEQAKRLRNQVAEGGLRFEAYLPPSLALWLLDLIEQGKFLDPSEAVFVILGEHKELEPHADLRRELLKRSIQAAADDPRPGISGEGNESTVREKFKTPLPEPARWEKRSRR